MGYPARDTLERFNEKFEPCLITGCWHWRDALDVYGYGRLQIGQRTTRKAHRVAYELFNGPIPHGMLVCHRCDVRCCVNPAHLFLGSPSDNNADMIAKGRRRDGGKPHPGEKNGRAILSETKVIDILLRHARGEIGSAAKEARSLGLHPSAVQRLLSGDAWRHIPRAEAALIALYGARQGERAAA